MREGGRNTGTGMRKVKETRQETGVSSRSVSLEGVELEAQQKQVLAKSD